MIISYFLFGFLIWLEKCEGQRHHTFNFLNHGTIASKTGALFSFVTASRMTIL
jgi:hypothetical protein